MKNIKRNILVAVLTATFLGSCNDDFLAEKQDLTGANEEVYQDPVLGQAYVDYVYNSFFIDSLYRTPFHKFLVILFRPVHPLSPFHKAQYLRLMRLCNQALYITI